jgi:hypothetical protein
MRVTLHLQDIVVSMGSSLSIIRNSSATIVYIPSSAISPMSLTGLRLILMLFFVFDYNLNTVSPKSATPGSPIGLIKSVQTFSTSDSSHLIDNASEALLHSSIATASLIRVGSIHNFLSEV